MEGDAEFTAGPRLAGLADTSPTWIGAGMSNVLWRSRLGWWRQARRSGVDSPLSQTLNFSDRYQPEVLEGVALSSARVRLDRLAMHSRRDAINIIPPVGGGTVFAGLRYFSGLLLIAA